MLIKTVRILCVRDSKTKISATVAEHELPILKLIHGEGNVIEQPDVATRPCEIEPEDEADRLSQKYGQEALFAAYGRLAVLTNGSMISLRMNRARFRPVSSTVNWTGRPLQLTKSAETWHCSKRMTAA